MTLALLVAGALLLPVTAAALFRYCDCFCWLYTCDRVSRRPLTMKYSHLSPHNTIQCEWRWKVSGKGKREKREKIKLEIQRIKNPYCSIKYSICCGAYFILRNREPERNKNQKNTSSHDYDYETETTTKPATIHHNTTEYVSNNKHHRILYWARLLTYLIQFHSILHFYFVFLFIYFLCYCCRRCSSDTHTLSLTLPQHT